MNKRKRVAAHKHRAHMKKVKEKRKLALGVPRPSIEAAKRRPARPVKKEPQVAPAETKKKVAEAPAAVQPEVQVPVEKAVHAKVPKAPREHRAPKKTAEALDVKSAPVAETTAEAPKKVRPSKAKARPGKSGETDKTKAAAETRKPGKPKAEPAA